MCVDGVCMYCISYMFCWTDIDMCVAGVCNNGTCVDDILELFWCNCTAGYAGEFCETLIGNLQLSYVNVICKYYILR